MGLFNDIFRPKAAKNKNAVDKANAIYQTLTTYQPVFTTWQGSIYESELIRAAIDARARHVAKLKIELGGSAKKELQNKLKYRPNSWQTWPQFLYRVSTILDVNNTCFIVPVLDESLRTVGYASVLPQRCEIVEYKGEPYLRYVFANGETAAVEMRLCVVLTKFQYSDDFFGETNDALRETMQLMHINAQGIQEAIKSGATYRFFAQMSNFALDEDITNERKRFTEQNLSTDSKDNNGLLLFPNTYNNIQQIKQSSYTVDAAQMELIQTSVYSYFGVNEDVLQNKTIGDAWNAFYEGAIEPFAIQFSEGMTAAIYTERERENGSYLMATSNRLQYMSNTDKLNVSAQMADRGIMTRNEIREIWNLPQIEGGDVPVIRGEYYSLDKNGQKQEEGQNNAGEN